MQAVHTVSAATPRPATTTVAAADAMEIVNNALGSTRRLRFAPTVERRLVHKAADSQVLLTDAEQVGADRFLVAAAWSPDHLLYRPGPSGAGDPTLLVESMRQSAIYLSHTFYGIPADGQHFVLSHLSTDIVPRGLPFDESAALPVVLDVTCVRTSTRPDRFSMQLSVSLYIHGRWYGRADFRWAVLPQGAYDVVRHRNRPALDPACATDDPAAGTFALSPGTVGRHQDRDVLLAEAPGAPEDTWRLRMDRGHPVHFDHDSDHVPGMVLLEALNQAAHASYAREFGAVSRLVPWMVSSLEAEFNCFGELDHPIDIVVRPLPEPGPSRAGFEAAAVQGDRTLTSARFVGAAPSWTLLADWEAVTC
ncbi:ScbA/BarX family gamma-butyrolactone biosynthesis protein [Streptomyces olivoreticuli]|uniref:ScbA/BarX family gamma-butyrolactone biosynthesis protein n=1 Tax=Streptomyces olivoreticuli TaxID=68246 RepID=UPI00265B44D3|nr:ScbA/BarX family gamma-butyrolactone biosynthesis protein [Streptomyces olivoreticuli]WKK27105.1 ScbA/BarX family gamma-butyrolactone biosynthesis protein [Streptomyces olivoreticuli]